MPEQRKVRSDPLRLLKAEVADLRRDFEAFQRTQKGTAVPVRPATDFIDPPADGRLMATPDLATYLDTAEAPRLWQALNGMWFPVGGSGGTGQFLRFLSVQTNLPATDDNEYHIYPLNLTFGGTVPDGRDLGNGTPFVPSAVFDYDQVNAAVVLLATGVYLWSIRFWAANWAGNTPLTWDSAVAFAIGPPVSDYPSDEVSSTADAAGAADTLTADSISGTVEYQPHLAYNVDHILVDPSDEYTHAYQVYYKHNGPVGGDEQSAVELNITYIPAVSANQEGA